MVFEVVVNGTSRERAREIDHGNGHDARRSRLSLSRGRRRPRSSAAIGDGACQKGRKRPRRPVDEFDLHRRRGAAARRTISAKLREKYGVVQDKAVHKYVTLVGIGARAEPAAARTLAWTFIVLDTDGVNAFAAPGGFIHITRGALALMQNEAELAGVLGHEISHVTAKHTINAIQKNKAVQIGASDPATPSSAKVADKAYEVTLENAYDRGDEMDADKNGIVARQQAPATRRPVSARFSRGSRNGTRT